jgi:hypothetical protein
MPGQPQYQPEIQRPVELGEIPQGNQLWETVITMTNEYRHARDLWGQAEADLYMVERFDVNPIVFQSMSDATVQRPATWEWVDWATQNEWALEVAPLTAGALAPKGDETFSHREWTSQFQTPYLSTMDSPNVREKLTASVIMERIQRSAGYEMLRAEDKRYETAVEALRSGYGDDYASSVSYRQAKRELDTVRNRNRTIIMTQFPPVDSKVAGTIVGERDSVTGGHLYNEILNIGNPATKEGKVFKEHMPEHFAVANQFASWFRKLEEYSIQSDVGKRTKEWWLRASSEEGQKLVQMLTEDAARLVRNTQDPDAKEYARYISEYIIDPLTKDWEWMESEFAPQLETYPTLMSGAFNG